MTNTGEGGTSNKVGCRCAALTTPAWPAPIFLVTTGAICAGLVEQSLPDILPDGIWSIEPESICLLNFDDAKAAHALNPQHVVGEF